MAILKGIGEALAYTLSLPERTVRSLAAGVGGASKLVTDTFLPRTLRGTTFYKFFLGNTQRFIIQGVGQVEGAFQDAEEGELPENYLARKMVGNVVDAAGIYALHISPLWFFALVGDVAGGTKTYLNRVVAELKKDGVLASDAEIETADALLDALEAATRKTALPFDAPPMSKEELGKLRDELTDGYAKLYAKSRDSIPSPAALWELLVKVKEQEKIPFIQMAGAMALQSTKAVGRASGILFHEKVILSYRESIQEISREGYPAFLKRVSLPYFKAMAGAFAPSKLTLTEKLFGKKSDDEKT